MIPARAKRPSSPRSGVGIRPIEFIGEIGDGEKSAFLENAVALLFPIDWPEPFGLVLIEAMACGTPVIAWRCGSVAEIVEDGKPDSSSIAKTRRCGRLENLISSTAGSCAGCSRSGSPRT